MKKTKTVEKNGRIMVSQAEERYPSASEVLMGYGFKIIFLNMSFGLLPVTIWGPRLKYFKCSLSQLYTTVSCLSFIVFCLIFGRMVFFPDQNSKNSVTNMVILMAMGIAHVAGYIVLLIRGHFLAKRFPEIWLKLCKLLQLAVIDVYGKQSHLLKDAKVFSRWAVWEFFWIATSTGMATFFASAEYANGMKETVKCYKLYLLLPSSIMGGGSSSLAIYRFITFHFGYFIWEICNSCHVLGTMLLCYIIIIITICIKSVNQQLREVFETVGSSSEQSLGTRLPRIIFNWSTPTIPKSVDLAARQQGQVMFHCSEEVIIKRLENTRNIMLIIEEIILTVGRLWGISLIIEVLILITSGTTETYRFLSFFKHGDDFNKVQYGAPGPDEWIGIANAILVNFFFLFRCCNLVDRMQYESKTTLHLLKQPSCQRLPANIQGKIEALKQDLSSTNLNLTASNYFQVGKVLLTSVFCQITTYVIVLLQFSQQDSCAGKNNSTQIN